MSGSTRSCSGVGSAWAGSRRSEERRVGKGLRSYGDWSSDVCSSDLPERKNLRIQTLTPPFEEQGGKESDELSLEDSPPGWAFTRREPVVLNRMGDERFDAKLLGRWIRLGLKSACFLPVVSHSKPLGALAVFRREERPFDQKEAQFLRQFALQVGVAVENALTFHHVEELREKLEEEKRYLEEELRTEYDFEDIIGESRPLKVVLKQVETVAPTDAAVLILGETGTGKELIARSIHHLSPRRERTFVRLNCAAIPVGLLESELFGHERGAFTGALNQKIGRLELADHGTLYLDEVGDIPLELQPKLLRALQEREFERLGNTKTKKVDVRLVAATNRDLQGMVVDHQFRSDLYYRLNVFPIRIPPLRERPEDIPSLVRHFTQKYARRMDKRIETIPANTMNKLRRWHWPGNVRELENFIERAVILTRNSVLNVPVSELTDGPWPAGIAVSGSAERDQIVRVLKDTEGRVGGPNGAAARLGLKRTTLISRMKKLGINPAEVS